MGSHPIGLEAAADINPAASLSTQTVTVYTRHNESCSKNGEPYWKRCHCMKYLYVYRENTSRQVSAKTRSWERAEERAQEIRDSWSPRKGPSARTGSKGPKDRGARGTDHGCCCVVYERSGTSEP
jgi:sarcosine oxidase delta subunit